MLMFSYFTQGLETCPLAWWLQTVKVVPRVSLWYVLSEGGGLFGDLKSGTGSLGGPISLLFIFS